MDAAVAVLVARAAFALRFEGEPLVPEALVNRYQLATAGLVPFWLVFGRATGLYRRAALRMGPSNLEAAFAAASLSGAALLTLNYALFAGDLSRAWIALVVLGLLVGGLASRAVLRRSRRGLVPLGIALERYAVVGDDAASRRLVADLTRAPGAPFRIVATVPSDLPPVDVLNRVRELRVDGLVLPPGRAQAGAALASHLSGTGIDVLLAPQIGELELRVGSIAMLHGVPLLRVAGLAPRRPAVRQPPRDRLQHGVAILGTRGVPANYGGFETFAERLALQLVDAGVATTVYCRSHYVAERSPWRGIGLVVLPTIKSKYFDTVVHTALSTLHLLLTNGPRDVILCNAANAPVLVLLRLLRRRVVLNVDGLEWRRSKWGVAGRAWYRMGEWLSVRLAAVLVTDADEVQTYYRVRHDTDSVMIPYGADSLDRACRPVPPDLDVQPNSYVLYVSRWERENNPLMVARAHATADTDLHLVMLGTATYDEELGAQVRAAVGPSAHLPGARFGSDYVGLQVNARCYVHATEVGGTHPALIEAMGAGNLCLVLDTPENREVAGQAAVYFADQESLRNLLEWAAALPADELEHWRGRARDHARARFSWAAVGRSYARLLGHERDVGSPA